MTTYRIQLNRKTAQSSICDRNESCAIQVSVGSKSYEGEKLADLLEWSAKRYHYIILLINDMPQRHNIGEHLLNAIEKVEDYGRKWIDRNQYILSNFSMLKIITSSTWLLHWQFKNVRECIHTAINNHSELNNAISHDTLEYHKRNKIDQTFYSIAQGRRFIIEELIIMELQTRYFDWDYIHAGGQLLSLRVVEDMDYIGLQLKYRCGYYVTFRKIKHH